MIHLILWTVLLSRLVSANVEKLIFMGPPSSISDLDLHILPTITPDRVAVRTQLHSKFNHTPVHPQAIPSETWFYLSNLIPNKRYEVRICWPAIQPTAFKLELLTDDELMQKQDLLQSLQKSLNILQRTTLPSQGMKGEESKLLFRVKAIADYFTMNHTLMNEGLVVDVDIILDEYIWNLVPRSLTHTGMYLLVAATVAVFAARKILSYLDDIASGVHKVDEAKDKKTS